MELGTNWGDVAYPYRHLENTLNVSYVGIFLLAQEIKNRLSYIVYTYKIRDLRVSHSIDP